MILDGALVSSHCKDNSSIPAAAASSTAYWIRSLSLQAAFLWVGPWWRAGIGARPPTGKIAFLIIEQLSLVVRIRLLINMKYRSIGTVKQHRTTGTRSMSARAISDILARSASVKLATAERCSDAALEASRMMQPRFREVVN